MAPEGDLNTDAHFQELKVPPEVETEPGSSTHRNRFALLCIQAQKYMAPRPNGLPGPQGLGGG